MVPDFFILEKAEGFDEALEIGFSRIFFQGTLICLCPAQCEKYWMVPDRITRPASAEQCLVFRKTLPQEDKVFLLTDCRENAIVKLIYREAI